MSKFIPKIIVRLPNPNFNTDCYPSFREFRDWLTSDLITQVDAGLSGANFVWTSNNEPPLAFNGVWARVGAAGKPDGLFMKYNGQWVRVAGYEIGDVMLKLQKTPQQPPWFRADGTNGTLNLTASPMYNPAPNLFLHQYVGY